MSRWFLSPWPFEGASCPTLETRPQTLILSWSTLALGSFCIQHFFNFLLRAVAKEWKDLAHLEGVTLSLHLDHAFLSGSAGCSIPPNPNSLITVKKVPLSIVHQRKCTIEIINILTFSAFPDLMRQQRSKKDSLFHFPLSFGILIFLLSFLWEHEDLYLLSPTEKNTLELGAGIWSGEVKLGLLADMAPCCRMVGTRHWMEVQHFPSMLHGVVLDKPQLTGRGVSTRKPGPMPVLRNWPLCSIHFSLLNILTHLLITWSYGNRPVIQAMFVLIAFGFPHHLAHVQNEEIKAFMGVKFYKESLIYKTDHILVREMWKLLWPWVVIVMHPKNGWKTFLLLKVPPLLC